MEIGIYTPYLNVCGGGEKYICKIAEILSKDYDVEFIIFENIKIKELQSRLNVDLSNVSFNCLRVNINPYFRTIIRSYMVSKFTKNYDLFINQENNTFVPSYAKKNIYICQLPIRKFSYPLKALSMFLPIDVQLKTYDEILTYSYYNKRHIGRWWDKNKIQVLYPPVDVDQFFSSSKKENIILSVGRFFIGGHNKKQLEMIRIFKQLYNENKILKDWEFHLVGGINNADTKAKRYLKECQKEARNYPIYFHVNIPFETLKEQYSKSKIYWHATGLHEDENKHPDRMEHFGITTVEAMAAGCVPVVIEKGGQPEIVRHMIDGFLWNSTKDLKKYTIELVSDNTLWKKMSKSAIKRSQKFGILTFKKMVKRIFREVIE